MTHTSRRKFIMQSAALIPAVSLIASCDNSSEIKNTTAPIVISTWDSVSTVNKASWEVLRNKGRALDAVEKGAIVVENSINCCVGLGGNPDRDGKVTLDACIMDDKFNCGSVAFLQKIKNPISVARKIMESSPHVMLVGEGAYKFALENGFEEESGQLSVEAEKTYKNWLAKSEYKPQKNIERSQNTLDPNHQAAPKKLEDGSFNHDTMGILALDAEKNLSGSCTTSGMGFKMHGRVGDSPIIGSGLYVDNEIGAATSSGQGEEVIRICGTHLVVEFMRNGLHPTEACKKAIERLVNINPIKAKEFQVGFLALNKKGEYGAYAIAPGFTYSVTKADDGGATFEADSYFTKG